MLRIAPLLLACSLFVSPAMADSCLDVDLRVSWDEEHTAQGIVVRLDFPEGLYLESDASGSVKGHTKKLTARDGLFDAVPHDSNEDGRIDRLNIGLLTQSIEPGPFVRVSFACQDGVTPPAATEFECVPEVSARTGMIESSCEVAAKPASPDDI